MIDFQTITVSDRCKEVFELQRNLIKSELQLAIIISHFGYISQDLLNGFTENTEEVLISSGEKKQVIKRIFSLLIEGLQNVRVHGEADDKNETYGSFILARDAQKYFIHFGSLVKAENKDALQNRIDRLNELDDEALKEHYMAVLTNGVVSSKGNAGLGFITMKMKSKSPIQIKFFPLSEQFYYFIIELSVQKEN